MVLIILLSSTYIHHKVNWDQYMYTVAGPYESWDQKEKNSSCHHGSYYLHNKIERRMCII